MTSDTIFYIGLAVTAGAAGDSDSSPSPATGGGRYAVSVISFLFGTAALFLKKKDNK